MKKLFYYVLLFLMLSVSTIGASSSDDYMKAKIDGTEYVFDLISANVIRGKIEAKYEAYNPRGEKMHTIILRFDSNITEGHYQSGRDETYVYISEGRLIANTGMKGARIMGSYVPPMAGTEATGTYDVKINYRSNDWMHYEGSFSAELRRNSLSGSYGPKQMSIKDAVFSFTLGYTKPREKNGNYGNNAYSWGGSAGYSNGSYPDKGTHSHSEHGMQCPECGGEGYITCPDCGGTGKMDDSYSLIQKSFSGGKCPRCDGKKKIYCPFCHGQKYID